MITLLDEQKITLTYYHDGKSQREIQKETGGKYIKEYGGKQGTLLRSENVPDEELIQSIVEKPTYDCTNRKQRKVTEEFIETVKY